MSLPCLISQQGQWFPMGLLFPGLYGCHVRPWVYEDWQSRVNRLGNGLRFVSMESFQLDKYKQECSFCLLPRSPAGLNAAWAPPHASSSLTPWLHSCLWDIKFPVSWPSPAPQLLLPTTVHVCSSNNARFTGLWTGLDFACSYAFPQAFFSCLADLDHCSQLSSFLVAVFWFLVFVPPRNTWLRSWVELESSLASLNKLCVLAQVCIPGVGGEGAHFYSLHKDPAGGCSFIPSVICPRNSFLPFKTELRLLTSHWQVSLPCPQWLSQSESVFLSYHFTSLFYMLLGWQLLQ